MYRRISHAIFDFHFDAFYKKKIVNINKNNLKTWIDKYKNNETSIFWTWIRNHFKYDFFNVKNAFARVIFYDSIKMCIFVHLMHHICRKQKRKIIIFCEWFYTQWIVEIAFQNFEYQILIIKARHKLITRMQVMKEFNIKNNDVKILMTSFRFFNFESNLQKNCFDVIYVDQWSFASNATQNEKRTHRMNQTRICYVYTLILNHNYNQIVQINACNKILIILTSMNVVKMFNENIKQYRFDFSENAKRFTENQIKIRIIQRKCETLYNQQFEYRFSRREWNNARDLIEKNILFVEIVFRQKHKLQFLRRESLNRSISIENFFETFKKTLIQYNADILFINDIFFIFIADMMTNKR